MTAHEINVTVQNLRTVVSVRGDGGEVQHTIVEDDLRSDLIELFQRWLRLGKLDRRSDFQVFGSLLYNMLFGTRVAVQFEQALQEVRTRSGERLRVRLSFQKAAEDLAGLPWEYLYFPDTQNRKGFFLATETQLVLTRYIPLEIDQVPDLLPQAQEPLRILVVVSQPTDPDLPSVLYEQVLEAIKKLEERHAIETSLFTDPTVQGFLKRIEEYQPHVLHFIGHGQYNVTEKRGEIALIEEDRSAAWKTDTDFAELVNSLVAKPRLILLHACEGAVGDFAANFAGLAPKLMRFETPAVVAMQYPITNQAAIDFSGGFYEALAQGLPVDDAVQVGRKAIVFEEMANSSGYSTRSFGTPVLHMNSKTGIILTRPGSANTTIRSAKSQGPGARPSPTLGQRMVELTDTLDVDVAQHKQMLEAALETINNQIITEGETLLLKRKLILLCDRLKDLSADDIREFLESRKLGELDPRFEKVIEAMVRAISKGIRP